MVPTTGIGLQWQACGVVFFGEVRSYGLQYETINATSLWVLPSTSLAASGFWDEAMWQALGTSVE